MPMSFSKVLIGFCLLIAQLAPPVFAQGAAFPPTPAVKLAVNPVTNKVYTANTSDNTVTAYDRTTGTSTTIAVGAGPVFLAVNPVTNRVYVNNGSEATLSVIDGATDTLIGTFAIGSWGPIAINPVTNIVYIVRMTGTGTDEVTFFNGNNHTWYTIATESFQPTAMAVNPATDRIYVAHYATGDVRVISGAFDGNAHPATFSIGMWSKPFAVAANPVTNRIYAITEDARGPIAVINGADNTAVFPAVTSGHAQQPKALAVDPVSNKVYAAFANEVIVLDGNTNALTYVPIAGASSGAVSVAINYTTSRVYVATALGSLSVIDGQTDTVVATEAIPVGTSVVGVNPVDDTAFFFDATLQTRAGSGTARPLPLATTITPLAGDASGPSGSLTMSTASSFSPTALPVRKVYYQVDSRSGRWTAASGSGPFTAAFSNLTSGPHTVYAFALDGQDVPLSTGPQNAALIGQVAAYTFTVSADKLDPSVSLASSANPSVSGESVTFTASVAGSGATPTGTVQFLANTTALCSSVALVGGTASCATSTLAAGSHSITAEYSGDAAYNARTSATITQSVREPAPVSADLEVSLSAAPNPVVAGDTITFTLTLSNHGPAGATGVVLTTGVPSGTSFVSASSGCSLASGNVSCGAGSLPSGSAAQFNVVVRTSSAGPITANAQVAGNEVDSSTANNQASGTVTVEPAPSSPAPLSGLSTRVLVQTGDNVMIGGFVIGGSSPKTVVVRARGPSLGMAGSLADPTLTLIPADGSPSTANDNWRTAANAAQLAATGFQPGDDRESAIMATLGPGAYTAIVRGVGGSSGIGIVEVYELDHPEVPLLGLSTRGRVATGDGVMIGGFIIQGNSPQTVVVRARGPSLGLAGALQNPALTIVPASGGAMIANDDWQTATNAAQLAAIGYQPGDPRESALLVTLSPGAYTAIVSGVGGATGVALVEVYSAP